MTYPTRKNLVVAISPTPYANPLLMDMVPADALFFLGVPVSGVALVGKGGAGGPYTFTTLAGTAVTSGFEPAPGLVLNPDGTITGTPAAQGVFNFVAQVEDIGSNTHPASFSINVQSGLAPVVFRPTIGEEGIAYRFEFIVRDLAGVTITSGFSVVSGTLPNGLAIAGGNTNVIAGTPTALAVGVTQATIRVTVGSASIDIPCTFTVVEALAVAFAQDRNPPTGWGGGAGSWLPTVIRGVDYQADIVITGGVPPYSISVLTGDPLPGGFNLYQQLLFVKGKTMDAASPFPTTLGIGVTDALGAFENAIRAFFILDSQQGRINPRKNSVDVPGGDGFLNLDFVEGDNVSLDVTNDGNLFQVRISSHPSSGNSIEKINGVGPDTGGDISIIGVVVDSNGHLHVVPGLTLFSAGNLSPLFTTSVANASSTPALTFALVNQAANVVFAGPASGGSAAPTFRALVAADLPSNTNKRGPGCIFTNGGLVLTGTLTSEIEVPYGFTGTGYTIVADATGSASIVVQHSTYSGYDTMSTLFTATLSSAKKNQASVSFSLSAGDIIRFSGSGFSGATRISIQLDGSPT